MIEIKIKFKSGTIGYYKLIDDNIENLFNVLGDAIRDNKSGVLEVIDLVDDKRTIVNILDVSTFGYKKIVEEEE